MTLSERIRTISLGYQKLFPINKYSEYKLPFGYIVVEARKSPIRAGAEAVIITPASEDWIQLPKQV
jgi:hypothetical protein